MNRIRWIFLGLLLAALTPGLPAASQPARQKKPEVRMMTTSGTVKEVKGSRFVITKINSESTVDASKTRPRYKGKFATVQKGDFVTVYGRQMHRGIVLATTVTIESRKGEKAPRKPTINKMDRMGPGR